MRWQWGVPILVAFALVAHPASLESGKPAVRLSVDPHWNGHTFDTPTFLGTITTSDSPVDPSTFVLFVDDRQIYTSGARWFLYPGSTFDHRIVENNGRVVTWEYRQACSQAHALEEGRHTMRFEFRDAKGNTYGTETSIAFFIDRTPPVIRFDGLSAVVEDEGSGAFLDSRLEGNRASPCPTVNLHRLCEELRQVASGWQIDCTEPRNHGLSFDVWRVDGTDAGGGGRTFLRTENAGWTTTPLRSGGRVTVKIESPGRGNRLAPGVAIEVAAYSRRLVLSADAAATRPAEDLVEWLDARALPFVYDAGRNEVVVYIRGASDHAGNVTAPVFSGPMTASGGSPMGSDAVQGVAQLEPILEITAAMVAPNPFNPSSQNAVISFTLSKPADLEVIAYDWAGEFVDTVYRGGGVTGSNSTEWGGQTEDGRKLGNGTYLIRIVASTSGRTESQVVKAVVWNDG